MIPIVTPAEMAAVDAAAAEPLEELIERAGAAVAWAVRRYLGGAYGHRVGVLVGSGNNGADGRVAASRLRSWGIRTVEFDASTVSEITDVDLVVDAAYGTGLSRPYRPPQTSAPVLAVDIPSGVDGLTGELLGGALKADLTVTFQALKPGLLLPPGSEYAGNVTVVDLGLDVTGSRAHLVEATDVSAWMPERNVSAHKWMSACWVIAGSAGMTGAASLAATAATNSGAGYVRLSSPGDTPQVPSEVVVRDLPTTGWAGYIDDAHRFGAMVVGPGLGRDTRTLSEVRDLFTSVCTPMVVDADGLAAIDGDLELVGERRGPTILTPHDGEFAGLTGHKPSPDRIDSARTLAHRSGATVLLKGPATIIAQPDGEVLVVRSGDERLATAGSGDVLSGVIGSLLAQGLDSMPAAAAGAWLHGKAALMCPRHGMVSSDLLPRLPEVLNEAHLG